MNEHPSTENADWEHPRGDLAPEVFERAQELSMQGVSVTTAIALAKKQLGEKMRHAAEAQLANPFDMGLDDVDLS